MIREIFEKILIFVLVIVSGIVTYICLEYYLAIKIIGYKSCLDHRVRVRLIKKKNSNEEYFIGSIGCPKSCWAA